MNMKQTEPGRRSCLTVIMVVVILGGALSVAAFMFVNKVRPEKVDVTEMIIPVDIMSVVYQSTQIQIPAQGVVTPAVQISLRPEVAGRVTKISPNLLPGGTFTEDEFMFKIDPRDYRIIVANQKQALAAAELALKQEQARARVAAREWALLESSMENSSVDEELALRIPQMKQAEAAVEAARRNLDKALLDLNRCTVKAPFNGIILRENIDLGQLVNANTESAVLTGTDEYWIQLSVPVDTLRFIDFPTSDSHGSTVQITQNTGNGSIVWKGTIVRLLGDVMESGRLARILVSIPNPVDQSAGSDIPLLIGSYVHADITGKTLNHVIKIPRSALHSLDTRNNREKNTTVWIMDDNDRLAVRQVVVDWRTEDDVFFHNSLSQGDRLITSNITTPIEGMRLVIASDEDGKVTANEN